MSRPFTFAMIADSHFQIPGATEQSAYKSDAQHNARNEFVVNAINQSAAVFTVHAGDVPHPVPGLSTHLTALDIAAKTYSVLKHPLYVVPGNHDVGDKPNAWRVASGVDDAKHAVFERYWGPSWQSFSHQDCRFILINTPIINGGCERETRQYAWINTVLAEAKTQKQRIFVFLHYPPFLSSHDEPEHYDNIALPGRIALLDTFADADVEAIFCGHVHHFFYNRYKNIPIYILPATSFVRPEYSELSPVGPGDEFGRNDVEKLGFFFVHIDDDGHRLEPVRTHGKQGASPVGLKLGQTPPPKNPLVASISNDLAQLFDIPCGNLDAFRRKVARNDLAIQALLEVGITIIRLPAGDFCSPSRLDRLRDIAALGFSFIPFSGGAEILDHADAIAQNKDIVHHWELVTSLGTVPETVAKRVDLPSLVITVIGERTTDNEHSDGGERYFSHFPPIGFDPTEPLIKESLSLCPSGTGFLARCAHNADIWQIVSQTNQMARKLSAPGAVLVELPKSEEGTVFLDDAYIAARVGTAFMAARAFPNITVTLDTFIDHDRGYYPKHGVIDRSRNPRPALHVLRHLNRLITSDVSIERHGSGLFATDAGVITLNEDEECRIDQGGSLFNLTNPTGLVDATNAG